MNDLSIGARIYIIDFHVVSIQKLSVCIQSELWVGKREVMKR